MTVNLPGRRPPADVPEDLPPGSAAVREVLAAAAAPAHDDELTGLATALDAFTRSRTDSRRKRMISTLAKLLAVKTLAATGTAAAAGGVALAAATGSLPAPLQSAAHNLVGAPAVHAAATGTTDTQATPEPAETPSGDVTPSPDASPTPDASTTPEATPTPDGESSAVAGAHPDLDGLCHAYSAGVSHARGKALSNPAFAALVNAAGGLDNVTVYCNTRTAATEQDSPDASSPEASQPAQPPAEHPTGESESHRNGAPGSEPGDSSAHKPTSEAPEAPDAPKAQPGAGSPTHATGNRSDHGSGGSDGGSDGGSGHGAGHDS